MFLDRTLVVGPFQCNCRLLACPHSGEAVLVDPGDEPQKILKALKDCRVGGPHGPLIRVKYVFQTHGHLDHIGATRPVCESLAQVSGEAGPTSRPLIALHSGDEELYRGLKYQGSLFGLNHYEDPLPIDHYFQDNEDIRVGEMKFSVLHTPGHSPGSVCLRLHENAALGIKETLFSGDTLFQGSVGRTDLWGGDQALMFKSIRERILTLDEDTRVCPGHGPETRIGIEKRENPFL
jgi:glyoxylase-like metal-dependent hydrolase (beta-lactamase superfamily II)